MPASECAFPGTNHSDDGVTVWHGAAVPLLLCGYHASRTSEPQFYEMVLGARDQKDDPVTCGDVQARCVCSLPAHDNADPHVCDCGGSWKRVGEEGFEVVAFPGGYTSAADAIAAMFGED